MPPLSWKEKCRSEISNWRIREGTAGQDTFLNTGKGGGAVSFTSEKRKGRAKKTKAKEG